MVVKDRKPGQGSKKTLLSLSQRYSDAWKFKDSEVQQQALFETIASMKTLVIVARDVSNLNNCSGS